MHIYTYCIYIHSRQILYIYLHIHTHVHFLSACYLSQLYFSTSNSERDVKNLEPRFVDLQNQPSVNDLRRSVTVCKNVTFKGHERLCLCCVSGFVSLHCGHRWSSCEAVVRSGPTQQHLLHDLLLVCLCTDCVS